MVSKSRSFLTPAWLWTGGPGNTFWKMSQVIYVYTRFGGYWPTPIDWSCWCFPETGMMECQLSSGDCRESRLSSHDHSPRPFLDTGGIQRAPVSYSRSSNRILEDAVRRVYRGSLTAQPRQVAECKAPQVHAGLPHDGNALGLFLGACLFFFYPQWVAHTCHTSSNDRPSYTVLFSLSSEETWQFSLLCPNTRHHKTPPKYLFKKTALSGWSLLPSPWCSARTTYKEITWPLYNKIQYNTIIPSTGLRFSKRTQSWALQSVPEFLLD